MGEGSKQGRLIEKGWGGGIPSAKYEKKFFFSSDIPKIQNFCKIPNPSPSSKAVHTPPCCLYFSNINIYKPYGVNSTVDTAIYIKLKVTLTHSRKRFF